MHLMETRPEIFGSGEVADITQSEDIFVFLMLKSFMVNIEEIVRGRGSKSSINQILVMGSGNQRVKGLVRSGHKSSSFLVLEHSFLRVFLDFF